MKNGGSKTDNVASFDDVRRKVMAEVEERLKDVPERRPGQLDGPRSEIYREVAEKYLSELREALLREEANDE